MGFLKKGKTPYVKRQVYITSFHLPHVSVHPRRSIFQKSPEAILSPPILSSSLPKEAVFRAYINRHPLAVSPPTLDFQHNLHTAHTVSRMNSARRAGTVASIVPRTSRFLTGWPLSSRAPFQLLPSFGESIFHPGPHASWRHPSLFPSLMGPLSGLCSFSPTFSLPGISGEMMSYLQQIHRTDVPFEDKELKESFPGGSTTFNSKQTPNGGWRSFLCEYNSTKDPFSPSYTGTKSPNDPFEETPRVIKDISDENEETSTTWSRS